MTEPINPLTPQADRCPFCGQPLAPEHPSTCANCQAARHAKGYWTSTSYPGAKMSSDGTPWSGNGTGRTVGIIAAVVVVVLVVAGATAYLLTKPKTHTVVGKMTVFDEDYKGRSAGGSCSTTGGYSDIGGQVVLKNGADETVGIGTFSSGQLVDPMKQLSPPSTIEGVTVVGCQFTVTIEDVPESNTYRISTGHRTPFEVTKAEMESNGWTFDLSLGDMMDATTIDP